MYQNIPIRRLVPHPENSNRMDPGLMNKLERNIRKSGNYETITVRPHPEFPGDFQILNGHHRVEILNRIGIEHAKCDVWEINDAEARLLVATLNRLEGKDVPELRYNLLKNLMDDFDVSQLEALIPESNRQLEKLLEPSKEDFKAVEQQIKDLSSHFKCDLPDLRILEFVLNDEQYHMVVKVLERIMFQEQLKDWNQAIYLLTKRYSDQGINTASSAPITEVNLDRFCHS
jgi:ParB-like chromosome segregation protein Spo0J